MQRSFDGDVRQSHLDLLAANAQRSSAKSTSEVTAMIDAALSARSITSSWTMAHMTSTTVCRHLNHRALITNARPCEPWQRCSWRRWACRGTRSAGKLRLLPDRPNQAKSETMTSSLRGSGCRTEYQLAGSVAMRKLANIISSPQDSSHNLYVSVSLVA